MSRDKEKKREGIQAHKKQLLHLASDVRAGKCVRMMALFVDSIPQADAASMSSCGLRALGALVPWACRGRSQL